MAGTRLQSSNTLLCHFVNEGRGFVNGIQVTSKRQPLNFSHFQSPNYRQPSKLTRGASEKRTYEFFSYKNLANRGIWGSDL